MAVCMKAETSAQNYSLCCRTPFIEYNKEYNNGGLYICVFEYLVHIHVDRMVDISGNHTLKEMYITTKETIVHKLYACIHIVVY